MAARNSPLKNLPTTWGLRQILFAINIIILVSEKPPHHMGIKTFGTKPNTPCTASEKPPHHMGIKTFSNLLSSRASLL